MDFSDALKLIKMKMRVRRRVWPPSWYLHAVTDDVGTSPNLIVCYGLTREQWVIGAEELFAEDWEVC